MPTWLVVVLVGVVLAGLGVVSLGSFFVWLGAFVVAGGLGYALLSRRQNR